VDDASTLQQSTPARLPRFQSTIHFAQLIGLG
jgi:hypothetical protein